MSITLTWENDVHQQTYQWKPGERRKSIYCTGGWRSYRDHRANKCTSKYSMIRVVLIRAVPYPRESGSGFSPQNIMFSFGDFMLHSWWTEWQCSRSFSECLQLSPANHHSTIALYAAMITPWAALQPWPGSTLSHQKPFAEAFTSNPALGWQQQSGGISYQYSHLQINMHIK
jgi:hypothetical protein